MGNLPHLSRQYYIPAEEEIYRFQNDHSGQHNGVQIFPPEKHNINLLKCATGHRGHTMNSKGSMNIKF